MTNASPGWYTDPEQPNQYRWWDGAAWTEHRTAPAYSMTPAAPLKAPEGTNWNTVWIWILVVLPFLPSLSLLTVNWQLAFDIGRPVTGALSLLTSPGYLATLIIGPISLGIFVWLSYLDWKILNDRGVPRPFHWAWGFLSVVYTIGRSVVVRRRTGKGISPMWVTIVLYVVYTIAMIAFLISIMTSTFSSILSAYPIR